VIGRLVAIAKAALFALLVVFMHGILAAPLFRRACRYYLDLVLVQSKTDAP
jgi:hypothetical protein